MTNLESVDKKTEENDEIVLLTSSLTPCKKLIINILIRKTILNFNEVAAYLLKIGSLKIPSDSLFSSDQALADIGVTDKLIAKGK